MIVEERLVTLENFYMPQLQRSRTIRIYLPVDYYTSTKKYKVLYMHDGSNLFYDNWSFSGHSWRVCESLDKLQIEGLSEGIILVAIDNSPLKDGYGRLDEYSPWRNSLDDRIKDWLRYKDLDFGGEGDAYADFIGTTLKEYVDRNYRTTMRRVDRIVAGSSMGALISLYIGLKYIDSFSNLALISPAFWFAPKELKEYIKANSLDKSMKIYMDIGTMETSDHENPIFPEVYIDNTQSIFEVLKDKVDSIDYRIFDGHEHSEKYWAERFPKMIRYFLGDDIDEAL